MSTSPIHRAAASRLAARALELFLRMRMDTFRRTDHLFAGLLVIEWLGAIAFTMLVSPLTWAGGESQTHFHVWTALVLGGSIISLPLAMALARPGAKSHAPRHRNRSDAYVGDVNSY